MIDLVGQTFGRLTVVALAPTRRKENTRWFCLCECGTTKSVARDKLKNGHTRSCGCFRREASSRRASLQTGANGPAWKGGRYRDTEGYIHLHRPDHPNAHKNSGYIREHRVVMEKVLGRYLLPSETVHHKNGVRDDNRPENLELRSGQHGAGARVEDLVEWAVGHLRLYAPHLLAASEKAA